jgi:ribosome-binding factor A
MKNRLVRVRELLKRELGMILTREFQFESPLVTISGVDITPDLKQAHVFVSAMGTDAQKRASIRQLEERRVMLQSEVSKRVVLKNTPHLNFHLDASVERGTRVLSIMDELGLLPETPKDHEQ